MISAGAGEERLAEEERRAEPLGGVEQRAGAQLARRRGPQVEAARRPAHLQCRPASAARLRRRRARGVPAAPCAAVRRARRSRARDSRPPRPARRGSSPCRRLVCAAAGARGSSAAPPASPRADSGRSSSRTSRCRPRDPAPARRAAARRRERAVRIVFDDRNAGAPRDRRQAFAPVGVHRRVRRIVQRGHRVDEARTARAQHRLDVIDAHAVVVHRHRNRSQAVDLKDLQCARIRRRFDDDLVARLGQTLRDDGDALRRAGEHDDARRHDRRGAARASCAPRSPRAAARSPRNRRTTGRSADRARRGRTTSRARRAATARRARRPARTRCAPLGLGGELAQHVGELADAPRRQRDPPRDAGRAFGLTAAQLRNDARARTDPLLDQALGDQLAVRVHDRAAVDVQPFGHRPLGRQPGGLGQGPRQDRFAQMLVDLPVERNDRLTVELRQEFRAIQSVMERSISRGLLGNAAAGAKVRLMSTSAERSG